MNQMKYRTNNINPYNNEYKIYEPISNYNSNDKHINLQNNFEKTFKETQIEIDVTECQIVENNNNKNDNYNINTNINNNSQSIYNNNIKDNLHNYQKIINNEDNTIKYQEYPKSKNIPTTISKSSMILSYFILLIILLE